MVDPSRRQSTTTSQHPVRSSQHVQYLNDDEINKFLDDLDNNGDGYINYSEVEQKLDQAHEELVPKPGAFHIFSNHRNHTSGNAKGSKETTAPAAAAGDSNGTTETAKTAANGGNATKNTQADRVRHDFLRAMMGHSDAERIPRDEFAKLVKEWKIPSLKQAKKAEEEEKGYFKKLPGWRKVRAYWAVHGPEIVFLGTVVAMQLAFGIWQLVKYQTNPEYRAAFGWGVVMAKTCAGALYPTFFFLILSMSRYVSTWLRRSYHISRFFNWDLSQEFHIRISCVAILLATLHALGHLTGSFVSGSNPDNEEAVAYLLGPDSVPRPYIDYVRSVPGFTGITALGLFYILSLLSIPQVRKWNYEVFQLGHTLMFPIIGLMMAHGTAHLLQWPMFGYFLAFPTLMVVIERSVRVCLGFHHIKATLQVLDGETVQITAMIPSERLWKYKAGQYIFLQVPKISFFQWHPFTVSFCRGNKMMVHIKTDGNWTGRLRELGGESGESEIEVGINGPFGAPAQRFYDFSHSIIIGAGIGVTPFSGILADLQHKDDLDHGGPDRAEQIAAKATDQEKPHTENPASESADTVTGEKEKEKDTVPVPHPARQQGALIGPSVIGEERKPKPQEARTFAEDYRRVDFHWMVRDRNYLEWLSDLLNQVSLSQEWHRDNEERPSLDIRINTHVTAKRNNIVTHVYRWLLEMHRTEEHPASPLTGLLNPTHYGRPDFDIILDEHYDDVRKFRYSKRMGRLEARRAAEAAAAPGSSASSTTSASSSDLEEDDPAYQEDEELKVGVFYCGAPVVGEILADKCRELTTRGRHDGTKIEYHFMMEVFG